MPKKVTRRSFLKRITGVLLAAFGTGTGGYYYANKIEPVLLDIQEHTIEHSLIPKSFDGLKIIQFSDTHLGFQYELDQLVELVDRVNKLQPDIILFTGDLMDNPNEYKNSSEIIPLLSALKATIGKYSIYGNHDHGGYGSDIYREIMEKSGFNLLLNDYKRIKKSDNSSIIIIGIDDAMLGRPDLALPLRKLENDTYKILLSHAPDLADAASGLGIHLQLSGHSHGGQVKIPFVGPLVTPPFAKKYREGFYSLGEKNPLTLYVNRGLGTTRVPFRFMSKPELTIFTLRYQK